MQAKGSENRQPRIWLLLGDKPGDNAQVMIIIQALGLPYEIKHIIPLQKYVHGKPRFKPSIGHVDLTRTTPLHAPWPDLIVTIGRRPTMVSLWIREQSANRTKVVLLGRPRRYLGHYALIIVPPQYRVPRDPRILRLDLPLMRINEQQLAAAGRIWKAPLRALQQPVIALFVGGPTAPFKFDVKVAVELMLQAKQAAAQLNGTLYISTSRRTPQLVADALQRELPPGGCMYRWGEAGDNPYHGLLAWADYFIVTGDSISMMVEVARLNKPLAIYPLPTRFGGYLWSMLTSLLHPSRDEDKNKKTGIFRPVGDLLFRLGLVGYSRDLAIMHRYLVRQGLASWLGEGFHQPRANPSDELKNVTGRIRQLLAR